MSELPSDDPEMKIEVQSHAITQENVLDTLISRYSSWNKLKKGIAWLMRFKEFFMHTCRSQDRKRDVKAMNRCYLSVKEMRQAEEQLVLFVQNQAFSKEIAMLRQIDVQNSIKIEQKNSTSTGITVSSINQRKMKTARALYKLNPKLEDGILRVGGRLGNAPIVQMPNIL